MGVFKQLGDPVCPACLCQHHEQAYAEFETVLNPGPRDVVYEIFQDGATIVQVQITTTKRCCIVVNTATGGLVGQPATDYEIERPKGTIRTQQEEVIAINGLVLHHHAAWEVLPAGTYTYYLVNRAGYPRYVLAAWIKAIASDCEG